MLLYLSTLLSLPLFYSGYKKRGYFCLCDEDRIRTLFFNIKKINIDHIKSNKFKFVL